MDETKAVAGNRDGLRAFVSNLEVHREPPTFDPGNPAVYRVDVGTVGKIPWIARKKPAIGPAGDFRLE